MTQATTEREWLPGPNVWEPESFVRSSSQEPPQGAIVLHEAFLDFSSTSAAGMPGIFSCPTQWRSSKPSLTLPRRASYDLTVEDIPLSAHKIVRFIISPSSDITVIPLNLQSSTNRTNHHTGNPTDTNEVTYLLRSESKLAFAVGRCSNIELNLVLWSSEKFTRQGGIYGIAARKFKINRAILLDPKCPGQFCPSESLVCLLGMDFLTEYPYLLFEPRYDIRGEIDFTLSGSSLVHRQYSTFTELDKKLVIHISARYDPQTGKIGCGAFFKSGSIFNLFSGVSKYDKDGKKHTEKLWERGIFMGIIKALHVVRAFPVGPEFTDVIIRTGSPPTNSLLSQIQHTAENLQKNTTKGLDDDYLEDRFSCSSPNTDLVMYIYRQFIRTRHGVKFHFDGFSTNENYDAVEAAGILATAGSEMEEFYMENEGKGMDSCHFSRYPINRLRGHKHPKSLDIPLLHHTNGFMEGSIYVSLGLDGYFYIPKEKVSEVMEAADKKACLDISREDAVYTLGYAPWEGEVAAEPNGFLETKNYEYHTMPQRSDFRTLSGILGEDTVNQIKNYLKENPSFTRETVLGIIQTSNREVKLHEFLSMQTKEYRDEYLKELGHRGLKKGWRFCKDKSWDGYLRRNTRLYDRDGWMRSRDGKQPSDAFSTPRDEKGDRCHCIKEKYTNQVKIQGTSRTTVGVDSTMVRKQTNFHPQGNETGRCTEHGERKSTEAGVEKNSLNNRTEPGYNISQYHYIHGNGYDSGICTKVYNTGIKDSMDTKELSDPDAPKNHTEIEADYGVAARNHAGQKFINDIYMDFRNMDQKVGTHDSKSSNNIKDSDDRGNGDDSDDHSSWQWSDPENLTNSSAPSSQISDSRGSTDPKVNSGYQQEDLDFIGTPQKPEGTNKEELLIAENCKSELGAVQEGQRLKEPNEYKGGSNPLVLCVSGSLEKRGTGSDEAENRWPSFDWMLENFKEDGMTALC